jgi:hypothetical protein
MRSHVKGFLTAILTLLLALPVLAQLPALLELQALIEAGVGEPILLANDGVKKEIKLTGEQDRQVQQIVKDAREKYLPDIRKAQGDRQKSVKLVLESTRETRERVHKALPDILKPDQLKRLNQIQIQVNGIASFKRQDVQEQLKLSDEQKEDIRKIGDGLKQALAELMKDTSTMPLRKLPRTIPKIKQLKNEATDKAIEKLTSEQKKTWQEMTGEKFDFQFQLPGGSLRRPR